jgi:hypothetical protein
MPLKAGISSLRVLKDTGLDEIEWVNLRFE